MKAMLQFVKRMILPVLATIVIVLALLVGVARLLLPQVPQYREDIQRLAEQATGFSVEFGQISAGVSRYGPELRLQQTRLYIAEEDLELVYAEEVKISLDVPALLFQQVVLPSHTEISGVRLDFVRTPDGSLLAQGRTLQDWLQIRGADEMETLELPDTSLWLSDVVVGFDDQLLQRAPTEFLVDLLKANLNDGVLQLYGHVEPELRFGEDVRFSAELDLLPLLDPERDVQTSSWSVEIDVPDLDIEQWVSLLPDEMSPIASGSGRAFVKARLRGGVPLGIEANIGLEDVVVATGNGEPIVYEQIRGQLTLERNGQELLASGRKFVLQTAEREWPAGRFDAQLSLDDNDKPTAFFLNIDFISLDNLMPLARAFAADQLDETGITGTLVGRLADIRVRGSLSEGGVTEASVRSRFDDIHYSDPDAAIEISGISGALDGSLGNGTLDLNIQDGRFVVGDLFRGPINTELLTAKVVWNTNRDGLTIQAANTRLQTPYGNGVANVTLFRPAAEDSGFIMDLSATANATDVRGVIPNLPKQIPAVVLDWLERSILSGEISAASFRVRGDLSKFPYTDSDDGIFNITVPFQNGTLKFAPGWPALENASGDLVFDGISMYSRRNQGVLAGTSFSNIDAGMPDMRDGVLGIDAQVNTDLPAVLRLLRESMIRESLGTIIDEVSASGNVSGELKLHLPIKSLADYGLDANLMVSDGTVELNGIDYPVTDVNGPVVVDHTRLASAGIDGRFLGQPVTISLRHPGAEETDLLQIVEVSGNTPAPDIAAALRLPFPDRYSGDTSWVARALFPATVPGGGRPFEILVESDLQGMAVDLPAPLLKSANSRNQLSASVRFPQPGKFAVVLATRSGIGGNLLFEKRVQSWDLQRGAVSVGVGVPVLPDSPGIGVGGRFKRIDVADWIALTTRYTDTVVGGSIAKTDFLRELEFYTDDLSVYGFQFPQSKVSALQIDGLWYIDVQGPRAAGSLRLPSRFSGDTTAMATMSRLMLVSEPAETESETESEAEAVVDPREFPALSLKVDDFGIQDLRFGALDAAVVRSDRGLVWTNVSTQSESFTTQVEGDWSVVDPVNLRTRTRLQMNLDSTDVAATLVSLGYDPLVVAKKGNANADLIWNGMPGMGMVFGSKGSFGFRIENGQVLNVDPGTGRLLGLLSFTSLPRRLSLDFRDVFNDGLGFDTLKGSFRLDSGTAYTCDVAMDGSVTDMAIIGSSDLVNQTYDQLVVVRPHMSNVIPLGTAVVAGPAIGAAVWLVAAIFKEPLSSIGETYYRVVEGWSEPTIEKVQRSDIDTKRFKDCAANLPDLALEDLAIVEELRLPDGVTEVEQSEVPNE